MIDFENAIFKAVVHTPRSSKIINNRMVSRGYQAVSLTYSNVIHRRGELSFSPSSLRVSSRQMLINAMMLYHIGN